MILGTKLFKNWNLRINFAAPILKEPRRLVSGSLILVFLFCSVAFAFSVAPDTSSPTQGASLEASGSDSFSFVVFGDNRDGDDVFLNLIKRVNEEQDIAFAVNTGDFVSQGRESEYKKYLKMISSFKTKIYHVPGNHDMVKYGYRYFRKYFGSYYYSFDYKNSHFVILNNAFQPSFHAKQFAWLKNDLASTKKENIFVFMHRPTFDPTEIYKSYVMSGRQTVKEVMGLFKKNKVDYVFAGHIHGYARAKRDGIVYIVAAGAGAPLYLPRDFGGFYHYVKISVAGNKIRDEVIKLYD